MMKGKQKLNPWTDLFATVRGQVENENGKKWYGHAGNDQIEGVEERLSAEGNVEGDVDKGLNAAVVENGLPLRRHRHDVPLYAQVEGAQVHAHRYHRLVVFLVLVAQVDGITVVARMSKVWEKK